jgi:hypothetical protein
MISKYNLQSTHRIRKRYVINAYPRERHTCNIGLVVTNGTVCRLFTAIFPRNLLKIALTHTVPFWAPWYAKRLDFCIGHQIQAYKKEYPPLKRVKPIPIIIIIFILAHAFGRERNEEVLAISYMITITFYYMLRTME